MHIVVNKSLMMFELGRVWWVAVESTLCDDDVGKNMAGTDEDIFSIIWNKAMSK